MNKQLQELIQLCKDAKNYIEGFPGEYYAGQQAVYDSVIETATELLTSSSKVVTTECEQCSEILTNIDTLLLNKAKELNLYVDFSEKTYDGDKEAPMDRFGLLEHLISQVKK